MQADLAEAEAWDRLEAAIDTLRTKQGEAKVKLDEAQSTGADTWKTVAKQIEQVVDDLGDTFSKLAGEVQAAVGTAGAAASKGTRRVPRRMEEGPHGARTALRD